MKHLLKNNIPVLRNVFRSIKYSVARFELGNETNLTAAFAQTPNVPLRNNLYVTWPSYKVTRCQILQ